MFRILFALCLFLHSIYADEASFEFVGKHFLASYMDCDREALSNIEELIAAMDEAVLASGATILAKTPYVFPPDGLTLVYLLSESHASIHTYPEHGGCFVDLFTCGDRCSSVPFDQILRSYLKPKQVNARVFLRHSDIQEVSLPLSSSLAKVDLLRN